MVLTDDLPTPPVLQHLGRGLLERTDELAGRLLRALIANEPAYAEAIAAEEELRANMRTNLQRGLQVLVGDLPLETGPGIPAWDTGIRRAQQRMPLEAVLRAYRLGGRILWEALVETCEADPEADPRALMEGAIWVWEVIDAHSAVMAEAYRREEARLRSRDLRQRQIALEALIQGRGSDPAFAREAARTLDLPLDRPMAVVVGLVDPPGEEPLRSPQEACGAAGFASVWQARADVECGLVSLEGRSIRALLALLEERVCGRVGVSPVFLTMAGVDTAYRLAEVSARTHPVGGRAVAFLDDRLPEALLASSPEVIPRLLHQTVHPLLALPAPDRDALLDTLRAVIDEDGSPTRAAAALYCHRNTVTYRLQRIEELTGRGVSTPRDKLMWTMALAALAQSPLP